jgi:hypothetical protein
MLCLIISQLEKRDLNPIHEFLIQAAMCMIFVLYCQFPFACEQIIGVSICLKSYSFSESCFLGPLILFKYLVHMGDV